MGAPQHDSDVPAPPGTGAASSLTARLRTDPGVVPEPGSPAPRRRVAGVLAFLLTLAVLAVPVALSAYAALLSFAGWSLYADGEPRPDVANGLGWTAVVLVLLALPVLAGLVTARVSLRPEHRVRNAWWAAGLLVLLLAAAACASRVV